MLYLLTDPIKDLHGPLKPPFLLAREMKKRFDICFVSPLISEDIAKMLRSEGFEVLGLGMRYRSAGSLLTFEAWLKRARFKAKSIANDITVNFSQCFLSDADVYYAQGPITRAINDMCPELKWIHRLAYEFVKPFLVRRDRSFNQELRKRSKFFIANSKFCANMYEEWGIRVDNVIHPPLDCELFKPTTSRPSRNYVLAYVGKEAKFSIIKMVADANIRIKAFGSKAPYIPKSLLNNPSIEFLGRVSDEELVNLYSNALYTFSTFTHEPFGYVPVESMACGTPVLTYNKQGPTESVIDGVTGWLANSDEELIELAVRLWKEGYPSWMKSRCRERALEFDIKNISKKWMEILKLFQKRTL